eukprot:TRINITY_DN1512_c0_g1_i3.p1 TRINITY_DN1512_c0_g1~~TRINITY_DN1512_c0_g1_i3.p1  ORF type:complete len:554 (-),score=157.99 TRINITY_DN1512_c0_g1_i3:418-2079(-)
MESSIPTVTIGLSPRRRSPRKSEQKTPVSKPEKEIDGVGIQRLKARIQSLERQLRSSMGDSENWKSKCDISAEKLRKALAFEKKLKVMEKNEILMTKEIARFHLCRERCDFLETENDSLEGRLGMLSNQVSVLESEGEQKDAIIEELRDEFAEKLSVWHQSSVSLKEKEEFLESQLASTEDDFRSSQAVHKQDSITWQQKFEKLQTKLEAAGNRVISLERELSVEKAASGMLAEQYSKKERKLNDEMKSLTEKNNELKTVLDVLETKVVATTTVSQLENTIAELEKSLSTLKAEEEQFVSEKEGCMRGFSTYNEFLTKLETLQNQYQALQQNIQMSEKEESELQNNIQACQSKYEEIQRKCKQIEEDSVAKSLKIQQEADKLLKEAHESSTKQLNTAEQKSNELMEKATIESNTLLKSSKEIITANLETSNKESEEKIRIAEEKATKILEDAREKLKNELSEGNKKKDNLTSDLEAIKKTINEKSKKRDDLIKTVEMQTKLNNSSGRRLSSCLISLLIILLVLAVIGWFMLFPDNLPSSIRSFINDNSLLQLG